MEEPNDKKSHRERHSGRKAEKKKDKKTPNRPEELTDRQRNPKAFAFNSAIRAERNFRRKQDIDTKKQHIPLVDRTPIEPPPILVVVVGPPKVGKSTVINNLIKLFTRSPLVDIKGPVTIVTGKKRRITFIECNNDINSMIDLAKIADLVLLLCDASFGFEMEVFEFLNICQVHGMPKIMGILTHLDRIKNAKTLKNTKKVLKHRFWTEVYPGAKLFYLSGIIHDEYLRNEIKNLGRFISVMKFRPLTWRTTHAYLIGDRYEDLTNQEAIRVNPKCDRTISLYGYIRGVPLKKESSIHVAGLGDLKISDISFLPDPCPLPERIKKRALIEKEKLIYAPFSGVGGIVYDKDAVYVELGGSHSHGRKNEDESDDIVTNLIDTKETLDVKMTHSKVKLFSEGQELTARDLEESDDEEEDDDESSEDSDDEEQPRAATKIANDDDEDIGKVLQKEINELKYKEERVEESGRIRRRVVFEDELSNGDKRELSESKNEDLDDQYNAQESDDESNAQESDDQGNTQELDHQSKAQEWDDQENAEESDDESNAQESDDQGNTQELDQQSKAQELDQQSKAQEWDGQENAEESDDQDNTQELDQQSKAQELEQQSKAQELDGQENAEESDDQDNTQELDQQSKAQELDQQSKAQELDQQSKAQELDQQSKAQEWDSQENAEESDDQDNAEESDDQGNTQTWDHQSKAQEWDDQENAEESDDQEKAEESDDQGNTHEWDDQGNSEEWDDQENVHKSDDEISAEESDAWESDSDAAEIKLKKTERKSDDIHSKISSILKKLSEAKVEKQEFEDDDDLVKESDEESSDAEDASDEAAEVPEVQWKDNLAQKAEIAFLNRQNSTQNLMKLVYGVFGAKKEPREAEDEAGEEEESIGGLFRKASRSQQKLKLDKDVMDLPESSLSRPWNAPAQNWLQDPNTRLIRNCFVTGKWKESEDAAELLKLDDADVDLSDSEIFGDFEDLETGEKHTNAKRKRGEDERTEREALVEKKRKLKEKFDEEYDNGDKSTYYDDLKQSAEKQAILNKTVFENMDDEVRVQIEGYRPGMYVRIEVREVPAEFVTNFDPTYPIVIGALNMGEENIGFVNVKIKKHRWYSKILKTSDPLIISLGWRRFQTIPLYSKLEDDLKFRYLKYTPQHLACNAHFWGPITPQGSGFLALQSVESNPEILKKHGFRIAATGVVQELDKSTQIMKKLKLVGYPYKIYKKTAFVKGMFNSALEVAKFEGARIKTVSGVRGQIKKAATSKQGCFRATFEDKILLSDIVFCRTWYRVDVPEFYAPVTTLLLPPEQKNSWRGVRTTGEIKREKGIKNAPNEDSLYKPIERTLKPFKPLIIHSKLQKALPYRDKPKHGVKHSEKKKGINRVAVIREPREQKVAHLMKMIKTNYEHKQEKIKAETKDRMEKHRQTVEAREKLKEKKLKEKKKEVFRSRSKSQKKDSSKNK